jgi:hypothetical protein
MSAKNVFNKIGFLSLMAATGLFGTSIGLGANAPVETNSTVAESDDFKVTVIQDGRWQVVDAKGNVYFLTENTNGQTRQTCEDRSYSYSPNMSH